MGIKKTSCKMVVYDTKDTSIKDFYVRGVCVGQCRNDVLAKWALRGPVLDTEDRVRRLMYRIFDIEIKTEENVHEAIEHCKRQYDQTVMERIIPIMLHETEHGVS